jgi:hypothetical protein
MIQTFINNEQLDLDAESLVTFKKSQQLNGIQEQFSYSNNFTLKNSSKNRRLLGINYLPNSKAKSMTAGYSVDVVLNGCIFLKRQTLKVQKENAETIPVYLIFTDSLFVAKAKTVLMQQINTEVDYPKSLFTFKFFNTSSNIAARTAPISAQDSSGFIVVEESVILLNLKNLMLQVFTQIGYAVTGDIMTDEDLPPYYVSSNVGWYGTDGTPQFGDTLTVFEFVTSFLKTFNGFIEVSDSSKTVGVYFWKNIESRKAQFVDYSSKFVGFTEYAFNGGLAKKNTLSYSESPDFFNGFFDNNKSIVETFNYLSSDFGAGNLRLFGDQDLEDDGSLPPRTIGELTEPQTLNIFRFEDTLTNVPIYYNGARSFENMYKAVSPNILEIWQLFHQPYTKNIALPTVAQLRFRYDAIMLSEFKMQEVFFIKQLATYWLPLELNFTTKKDEVRVKALMIERTPADVPIVFDQNLSVDFYGDVFILDVAVLYAAYNESPAQTIVIRSADLTKNSIFVNGAQVLSFPASFDVSAGFELKVSNIEAENVKSNSDILFEFVSAEGGTSRTAKINVAHNGRANFLSEFRSEAGTVYRYAVSDTNGTRRRLNYAARITTPLNIADTFAPMIGDLPARGPLPSFATLPPTAFKVLQFDRASSVSVELTIGRLFLDCSNRGGGAEARTKVSYNVWKNGAFLLTVYSNGAIDRFRDGGRSIELLNVTASKTFSVAAGDSILIEAYADLSEEDRAGSGTMDGAIEQTNVIWKFRVSEQL